MDYISIGLIYFFEFLITISFCNRVMDKKIKYSSILVSTFPLYVVGYVIYFMLENLMINVIVSALMYFFTILIGYKERFYKQVIYSVYLTIIMYVSEAVFIFFVYSKYQPVSKEMELTAAQQMLVSIAVKIVNFILVQLLALIIQRKSFNDNKKLLPLFIYPMISLAFTIQFYGLAFKYGYAKSETNLFIIISCIDAIMCIAIFMYYGLLDEKDRKLKEFEKEQQFVELNNSFVIQL